MLFRSINKMKKLTNQFDGFNFNKNDKYQNNISVQKISQIFNQYTIENYFFLRIAMEIGHPEKTKKTSVPT